MIDAIVVTAYLAIGLLVAVAHATIYARTPSKVPSWIVCVLWPFLLVGGAGAWLGAWLDGRIDELGIRLRCWWELRKR